MNQIALLQGYFFFCLRASRASYFPRRRVLIPWLRSSSLGEQGLVGGYNLFIYFYLVAPFNWEDKDLYLHTLCDYFSQLFFGTIPLMRQGRTRVNFVLKELVFLALLHSNACTLRSSLCRSRLLEP